MTEKLEIMKLKEVRLMNTLDGEKELVWKLNVDRYIKQLRSELEEAKKTIKDFVIEYHKDNKDYKTIKIMINYKKKKRSGILL